MPRSLGALIALMLLCLPAAPAVAATGDPLDRANVLGRLTFEEAFDEGYPNGYPSGWANSFWYGTQSNASSHVYGSAEDLVIFSKSDYNGINPFSFSNQQLIITTAPLTPAQQANPLNGGRTYSSGLFSGISKFSQTYGYWEARLHATPGVGIWPAFWLLGANVPTDGRMEIDVLEALGATPTSVYQTTHWGPNDGSAPVLQDSHATQGVDWTKDHIYGVLITPTWLVFYVDDVETAREATAGRYNFPMYPLLSLGVGPASWYDNVPAPGWQGGSMTVSYVRAFALAPGVQ